jgi:RHS repeat-associated protein
VDDNYYPFGLAFNSHKREGSLGQNYLYNGMELQNELKLGWYDYGARMYMSDIGRWGSFDPHSDKYLSISPFSYTMNNPVRFIDPDGTDPVDPRTGKRVDPSLTHSSLYEVYQRHRSLPDHSLFDKADRWWPRNRGVSDFDEKRDLLGGTLSLPALRKLTLAQSLYCLIYITKRALL